MPLLFCLIVVATFMSFSENLGTFIPAWANPGQNGGWHPVLIEKPGCWCLLVFISVVLVAGVHRGRCLLQGAEA